MKYKIRTIMIAIAVVAALLAIAVRYPIFPFLLAMTLSLAYPVLALPISRTLWSRGRRRGAAIGFGVSATLTIASCSAATIYYHALMTTFVFFLWPVTLLPSTFAFGVAWACLATQVGVARRRSPPLAFGWIVLICVIPASMFLTLWPLHLAFALARPDLDRLADQIQAGQPVAFPFWIGPYRLAGSSLDSASGTVSLFLNPDPGGPSGFVRIRRNGPIGTVFPVGSDIDLELAGGWSYRQDDRRRVDSTISGRACPGRA